MNIFRAAGIGGLIFGVLFSAYVYMPKNYRYSVDDWFTRLVAEDFDWPPDDFSPRDQADFISELERHNYKPRCYGNLEKSEKIGAGDDYSCWFVVPNAFENIPARMVTVWFEKGKLSNVIIRLPDSSFQKLSSYLNRRLAQYQRIEKFAGPQTDIYGKPLAVWAVKNGFVTTSAQPTEGKPITVLWSDRLSRN